MRSILKFAAFAAVLAVLALPQRGETQAFVYLTGPNAKPIAVASQRVAADNAPALYIKYVGHDADPATGTTRVATVAGASITFTLNGAAYDGFECPVAAPLGGVIDTTNADCDTLGEVVDIINGDVNHDFVAFIGAGLRTDAVDTTANLLSDAADDDVMSPEGEIIYWDTSVSDDEEIGFWDVNQGVQVFLQPGQTRASNKSPFANSDNVLVKGYERFTNAGNITALDVYCVVENYAAGSEVATVLYSEPPAATTVYNAFPDDVDGGLHCTGGKLFVRVAADSADTSAWLYGLYGYRIPRN